MDDDRTATTVFDSADPQAVWEFLDDAYGTSLRIADDPGRFRMERARAGALSVDRMRLAGSVGFDTDPIAMFTVMECRRGYGTFDRQGLRDRLAPGDVMATAPPGHGYAGSCGDLDLRLLNLDLGVLHEVATERHGTRRTLRFRQLRTTCERDTELWTRLVDFVAVATRPGRTQVGGRAEKDLARLVARTVLDVFPNSTWDEPDPAVRRRDARDASAAAVRRAVAFIDSAADRDLSVGAIAEAARVSPRALQAAFRRHLDTTPTSHLQRTRLELARRGLTAAGPGVTVSSVASRWGFYNHGRFAASYRSAYGELPSATLARVAGDARDAQLADLPLVDGHGTAPTVPADGSRDD